jgi:hypothetical protein
MGRHGTHTVSGTVTYSDTGEPAAGLRVVVRDDDLLQDDTLGMATTDEQGHYQVEFDTDTYHDLVFDVLDRLIEGPPDVYIEVTDDAGTTLASTADSVITTPAREERIDVEVPDRSPPGTEPSAGDSAQVEGYEIDRGQLESLSPETLVTAARSLSDPSTAPEAFGELESLNGELAAELTRDRPNTRKVERIFTQLATEKHLDPQEVVELETAVDAWWMNHRRRCDDLPEGLDATDGDDYDTVTQPLPSAAGQSWESVALFFNFKNASPDGYSQTTVADAKEWLDEGHDPANISISEFVSSYFDALSYGEHPIAGIDTPRDDSGDPKIPTIDVDGDPPWWGGVINDVLQEVAEDAWNAAGRLEKNGTRWIPSVVLIENYDAHASAKFGGFDITVDGTNYRVGDRTHIEYSTGWYKNTKYRGFWDTLCHEYVHNFVEFGDLYGPQGTMIYWDMLGDGSNPRMMSDISSVHKAQAPGWNYSIDETIEGSKQGGYYNTHTLEPYATSGDALKIVPDPENNPYEYFLVEYRTSTGDEVWRPDGGLSESGLLVNHVNERFKQLTGTAVPGGHWGTADAPYIDAELADYEDKGMGVRSAKVSLAGTLYTGDPNRDNFGPSTEPSSDFYGGRSSSLSISDVDVTEDRATFSVSLDPIAHKQIWTVSADDRGLAGRFTTSDTDQPMEVYMRDDDSAALLVPRDGQWFVEQRQAGRIDGWNLGSVDREYVGDLDGDGQDEVFIRSDNWAGVLQWADNRFEVVTMTDDAIDQWDLTGNMALDEPERALIGDFDGDDTDEIFIRTDDNAGVLRLGSNDLTVETVQQGSIGGFSLSHRDTHEVGQFSATDRDEILVNGDDGLALLRWDDTTGQFDTVATHPDSVDDWGLNTDLEFAVADLDDDDRDEAYVRRTVSDPYINESAVFEWTGNDYNVAWSRQEDIKHLGDPDKTLAMTATDESYAGGFFPGLDGRDGILHVANDRVSFLSWKDDTDEMRVRYEEKGGWYTWQGDTKLVIGNFQDVGPENSAGDEFIADHTASAFLHNTWGTGELSMDYEHTGIDIKGKPGITWLQEDYLVGLHAPELVTTLHTEEPVLDSASATFSATPRGVIDAEEWTIEWFDDIPDEGQSLGTTDPGERLTWNDLPSVDSTLVYAKATNGQQELTDWVKLSIRKRQESYLRNSDTTLSGYVTSDGTVVPANTTTELIVGDDEQNVASHALLTFDLSTLPGDVDPSDVTTASLEIILSPPEGTPYADLLDLSVVHCDYGSSLDAQDYRPKSLTFRPGRTVVNYDGTNNWGSRSVDVKRHVQDAIRNRTQLDQTVQFCIYHRTGTDNDDTADYTRVQSEDPANSAHHSQLRIEYDNTP